MDNEKDWRKLERLVFEYVEKLLGNSNVISKELTVSSHDSGYDGTWLVLSNNNMSVEKVIMESKYRNTLTSLPLNNCAKAIIISFNMGARKLYIGTNILFSPQAKEEVSKFKYRSNLNIQLINGIDLNRFIEKNKNFLLKKNFSNSFLKKIVDTTKDLSDSSTNLLSSDSTKYTFDDKRNAIITDITDLFLFSSCINIVTGGEGIGKSILCYEILNNLKNEGYDSVVIDLSLCTSTRTLYINILEAIWGVELKDILLDKELKEYIDVLISTKDNFSEEDNSSDFDIEIPRAVKQILLCDSTIYNKHQDVFLYLLLLYISKILSVQRDYIKLVIMFENINKTTKDILMFLNSVIRVLNENFVRILLEIRTPLLISNMSPIDSNHLYDELTTFGNVFNVDEFDNKKSAELIAKAINLSPNVCDSLANALCHNPLEICCAIELLNKKTSDEIKMLNKLSEKQLKNYWDRNHISMNSVVMTLVNSLSISIEFRTLFELTIIFNGAIKIEVLNKVFCDDEIIDLAVKSKLYIFSRGELICKHLRFISAMKKTSNKIINYSVAIKLIDFFKEDQLLEDPFVELNILYALDDTKSIPSKLLEICEVLMLTHQYDQIIDLISSFIDIKNNYTIQPQSYETHIILLLKLLHCVCETHSNNNDNYKKYYDEVEKYILLYNPDKFKNKYWVEYQLMLWDKAFTSGKFDVSLDISSNLFNRISEIKTLFDKEFDCIGRIYTSYGLSIKSIYSGAEAEKIFKDGLNKYPESYYCKASLLSQEGNHYLKHDPKISVNKYSDLLKIVEGKLYPYREVLHTRVDISMSYFLCGDYAESIKWANESINISEPIGLLSQKGRALNILGCCYGALHEYERAKDCFEDSMILLINSNAQIYSWRAQMNYASILLHEDMSSEKAITILQDIYNNLISNNLAKILNDSASVSHQCLLLIMMYFYSMKKSDFIKEIQNTFSNTLIINEFKSLIEKPNWKSSFNSKVKFVNGIIFVTG